MTTASHHGVRQMRSYREWPLDCRRRRLYRAALQFHRCCCCALHWLDNPLARTCSYHLAEAHHEHGRLFGSPFGNHRAYSRLGSHPERGLGHVHVDAFALDRDHDRGLGRGRGRGHAHALQQQLHLQDREQLELAHPGISGGDLWVGARRKIQNQNSTFDL